MARYYFHTFDGDCLVRDSEGLELADMLTARKVAVEGLRDMAAGELRGGTLNIASVVEIEDEDRHVVASVAFAEAVAVAAGPGPR